MITVLDLRGGGHDLAQVLPRAALDVEAAMDAVRPIVAQVRDGGVRALLDLGERLDGVRPASLRVPADDLARALDALDPAVRAALEESVRRARLVHGDQRREEHVTRLADGGTVTARWLPVDRVGLYVPGGRAVYPSSVVMNVVPALEAGVESLAISSPPQRAFGGLPHPTILAAAALLGVEEVYAVGGAQAVAMFAYGARDDDGTLVCRPVELVTGPGNIWVTAAKRLLKGRIGIDSEAGPTEIAILADDTADPRWVAADLVSQAEHDVVAAAVLVTPSEALAGEVLRALTAQVPQTRHADRIREALGGPQSAVVLVDDLEAGLDVVNAYAAEHLEIHTRSPASVARRVRNAGAVFVGPFAPVSLGDYCAGSNHVLPTGGSARHSSGLSVQTFLRAVHLVEYDERALQAVSGHVLALAEAEDLPAHGQAVSARLSGSTGTAGGAAATPRLSARARVATDAPGRYAKQLVSHLGRKVEFETSGPASTFALGAGGAGGSIEEGEGVLVLTAHAPDATGLATVKDVLGRHLERFGERAGLRVTWQDDGPHGPAGA